MSTTASASTPPSTPDRGAAPAAEQPAADHHRGDGVEFVADADARLGDAEPRGKQHAGDRREQPAGDIGEDQVLADIDAGKPHGFLVDAERKGGAARDGMVQVEPDGRHGEREDDEVDRHRPDEGAADQAAEHLVDRVARRVGIDVGQPAQAAHRRQRDDEGLQVEARGQPAVEEADRRAHRQRDGDRRGKMHLLLQAGGEQPGQRQHRADRQVDAAGADHHQHAEAEEAVGDDLARDVDDVALGEERVRRERREDDEQQDRGCENACRRG